MWGPERPSSNTAEICSGEREIQEFSCHPHHTTHTHTLECAKLPAGLSPRNPSPEAVARTHRGMALAQADVWLSASNRLKITHEDGLPGSLPPLRLPASAAPAVSAYLKPGRLVAWIPVLLISSWVLQWQTAMPHPQPARRGIPTPAALALGRVGDWAGGVLCQESSLRGGHFVLENPSPAFCCCCNHGSH